MDSDDEEENYITRAELQAKRSYLNEEIAEMGFDQGLFTEFFRYRAECDDLELVSFDLIGEIVREFKSRFTPDDTVETIKNMKEQEEEREEQENAWREQENQRKQQERENHMQQSIAKEELREEELREEELREEELKEEELREEELKEEELREEELREEELREEEFKEETTVESCGIFKVHCVTAEDNELSQLSSVEVLIISSQTEQGGLFSKDYTTYTLRTKPAEWLVVRRYSDFLWLREGLSQSYPGVFLPPIPPKQSLHRLTDHTVLKRRRFLSRFLNSLCKNPLTLRSSILLQFLKEADKLKLCQFRKLYKKNKRPETVEKMLGINGEFECCLQENHDYAQQIAQYANVSETVNKSLKRQTTEINNKLRVLSATLANYSAAIEELQQLQLLIPANQATAELYGGLHEALLEWSSHELEKTQTFSEYFSIFFKYGYMESEVYREFLREYEIQRRAFLKAKGAASEKLKNLYGYYNVQLISEAQRVARDNLLHGCRHFSELADRGVEQTSKLHVIWSRLLARLTDILYVCRVAKPN